MKTALIVLSSALTVVGGHLLNRRWDRAVFFYLLLFAATWFGAGVAFFNPQWGGFSARQLFGGALLLLWLIGLLVTVRDIRRPDDTRQPAWSITGGITALVLTLWSTLIFGWGGALVLGKLDRPWQNAGVERAGETTTSHRTLGNDHFSHYIYSGHIEDPMVDLPEPPKGKGKLVGRVEYEGRPAAGVVLRLFLNSRFRSARLTTDENGRFTLDVPPGRWEIDALITESWPGRPEEDLIPLTGDERHLGQGDPFDWSPARRASRTVDVPADGQPSDALVLRFRDPVALLWPGREGQTAGENDTLSWLPFPEATQYRVALHGITRRGDTTTYTPLTQQVVDTTRLPLNTLQRIPAAGEEHEYDVVVFAYDSEGRPLSRNTRFFGTSFTLEDSRLIGDTLTESFGGTTPTAEEFEQLHANEKRLDAVRVLLDEELPRAAEALLQKVDGPTKPGRREALTAYLRAAQGRCEEAREMAETAKEKGTDCMPESQAKDRKKQIVGMTTR
ncbi:hypothetical protein [Thiohalomonas denitrificans]|uniref:hypothetical protein n=1 Tax=Thiohalomonas denitrificans TaxID=415747 RepID=UPI0026F0572A|nr:hypothetical protein [Thiohalomonas denitrificans]